MTARGDARHAYDRAGLSYASIGRSDLRRLRGMMKASLSGSGVTVSRKIFAEFGPSLERAEIRCSALRFSERELVRFARNGQIGLAGWADDNTILPIAETFSRWCAETAARKGLWSAPDG